MKMPAMKIWALSACILLPACATGPVNKEINRKQNAKMDKINIATYDIAQEEGVTNDPELFFNLLTSEIEYNDSQKKLIDYGRKYLGIAYSFGEKDPNAGFDCSGFTQYAYKNVLGLNLPRTAKDMASVGTSVKDRNQLVAGDLVFFNTRGFKFSHVGIYIGEGRFYHASTKMNALVIGDMNSAYFASRYNGARRVIDMPIQLGSL